MSPMTDGGTARAARTDIERSQYARLILAAGEVVGELGYHGATIAAITRRAGVSKKTFYVFFADKEEAVLAAYELAQEAIARALTKAGGATTARDAIDAALREYLSTLAASDAITRMFLIEALAATPRIRAARREGIDRVAAFMSEALDREGGSVVSPGREAVWVVLAGLNEICVQHLATEPASTLTDLHGRLAQLLATLLGIDGR